MCMIGRFTNWLLLLSLFAVALSACSKPRKISRPRGAQKNEAADPKADRSRDVAAARRAEGAQPAGPVVLHDAVETTAPETAQQPDAAEVAPAPAGKPVDPLAEKLKQLKFKARREVVWARAAIDNISSYKADLEKFDRDARAWGAAQKVPESPDLDGFQKKLRDLASANGIVLAFLEIQAPTAEHRELPEVVHGEKPFDFEDADIRDAYLGVMRVGPADRESVKRFLRAAASMDRLIHFQRAAMRPEGLVINFEIYAFRNVRYPTHVVEARDLQKEMRQAGIDLTVQQAVEQDPIGHLQNASMSYREFNASLGPLNEAMKLLSESKFRSARLDFYRRAVEAAQRASSEVLASPAIESLP